MMSHDGYLSLLTFSVEQPEWLNGKEQGGVRQGW